MVRMTPPTCSALPEPRPGVTRVAEYCMMRQKPWYKTMASPTPHRAFNTLVACRAHTVSVPPPPRLRSLFLSHQTRPPPLPFPAVFPYLSRQKCRRGHLEARHFLLKPPCRPAAAGPPLPHGEVRGGPVERAGTPGNGGYTLGVVMARGVGGV